MQKKIVILGGVGLIGTHLSLKLVAEGEEVYCVDIRELSSSPLLRDIEAKNFHFVRHNIATPFTIRCDEVYNLSSPARLSYDRQLPTEVLKCHILGAFNTLETARTEFARVLYASSSQVYTPGPTLEFDSRIEQTPSAEGARAAEMIHHAYFDEYGVDCRIARIFNTYGSGCDTRDRRVVMRMITSALRNRPLTIFGSGEQQRNFCWVGDIIEGLKSLMETAPDTTPRTVDFGSDNEVTIRRLAEKIIELTGSRSEIQHIEARRGDVRYRRPNLEVARRELGWRPRTSLDEGLKRTIEYVEQQLSSYRGNTRTWIEIYG